MINMRTENLIAWPKVNRHPLLRARGGKCLHPTTVERWRSRGLRGVVLESIKIGGARFTSEEAIVRFVERLSDSSLGADAPRPSDIAHAHEQAEGALAAAGI